MSRYIIRTMSVPHCKLGPHACEDCRKASVKKAFLLDIDPPDRGLVERPIVEFTIENISRSSEYDVVKGFSSVEEALAFDAQEGLGAILVDSD